MPVEVVCPRCEKRYRVHEKYAGKSATCKACGGKMRVPAPEPEPVSVAADVDGFDFSGLDAVERAGTIDDGYTPPIAMAPAPTPAPAAATLPRGLQYAAPGARRGPAAAAVGGDTFVDKLRDRWLPIGLIAVCYGIPLLIKVVAAFATMPFGPAMGNLVGTAIGLAVLVKVIIPIAVYGLNIGARMTDFEPPGDVAYRLFAAYCGVPAAIVLVTMLAAGSGAVKSLPQLLMLLGIALGIGLAVSYFLLWFLLRIGPGQAAAAWAFAGMFYVLGSIVGGIVIAISACGVGLMFAGFGGHH
jgi:hypothetical protein